MYDWAHSVEDLLGWGVRVAPEQVALLDSTDALAVRVWGVPDPYHTHCGCRSGIYLEEQRLVLPQVVGLSGDLDMYGTSLSGMSDDIWEDAWRQYPSVLGLGEQPGNDFGDEEPVVARIWDVWPISPDAAESIDKTVTKLWYSLRFDAMEAYGIWLHGMWEPEGEDESLDLEHTATTAARELSMEAVETYLYELNAEAKQAWQQVAGSSRKGWRNLERTIHPAERERFRFDEGVFSPWY